MTPSFKTMSAAMDVEKTATPAAVQLRRMVQLTGLKTEALNDAVGFVVGRKSNGRFVVRLTREQTEVAVRESSMQDVDVRTSLTAMIPGSDHAAVGQCPTCHETKRIYEAACCGGASCLGCLATNPRCGHCNVVGQTRWASLTPGEWRTKIEDGNVAAAYVLGEQWSETYKNDAIRILKFAAALGHRRSYCLLAGLLGTVLLDDDPFSSPETKAASHIHYGNFLLHRVCLDDDGDDRLNSEIDLRQAGLEYAKAGRDKRIFLRGWKGAVPAFNWITATCSLGEALANRAKGCPTPDAATYLQLALDYYLQAKQLAEGFAALTINDFDDDDAPPDLFKVVQTKFTWFQDAVLRHLFYAALALNDLRTAHPDLRIDNRFNGIIHVALLGQKEQIL